MKHLELQYDIVVCGGGMAGICAAIAAARHNAQTALVQDRPVLGGNASSEIRVGICGAGSCGGWPIDIHNPGGITDPKTIPATNEQLSNVYSIPWRILYSRNIANCLFAGRNVSTTHAGMGSTRVMATCAVMGQAAGTGAALCKQYDRTPRDIGKSHISELQQILLHDDAYIPEIINSDTRDVAHRAIVSASSEVGKAKAIKVIDGISRDVDNTIHHWDSGNLPAWLEFNFGKEMNISSVEIKFDSNMSKEISLKSCLWLEQDNWQIPEELIKDYEIMSVSKNKGWETLYHERNNFQRFRRHNLGLINTHRLRLQFNATHGCSSARVFEVRIYA